MYDLARVREELPVLSRCTYLNVGTFGIMASSVLDALLRRIAAYEASGHLAYAEASEQVEVARRSLATFLGADVGDVGFARSTTEAANWAVQSLALPAGSEVILSDQEHQGILLPWLAEAERRGLELRYMPISVEPQEFAERLRRLVTSRTRAVVMSHVTTETGARQPVNLIREVVPASVTVMIDIAQSLGQIPVTIADLNADLVVGNCYKWLCGPKGTAFLWWRADHRGERPAFVGLGSLVGDWDRTQLQGHHPSLTYLPGARSIEYASHPLHLFGAVHDAIVYLQELGLPAISAHIAHMTRRAKAELANVPGVTLLSPPDGDSSSGLVAFAARGIPGVELSRTLWSRYRIIQRRTDVGDGVRISCAYFTTDADLAHLIEALRETLPALPRGAVLRPATEAEALPRGRLTPP